MAYLLDVEPVSAHVAAFADLENRIVERGNVSSQQFTDFLALTRNLPLAGARA